MRIEIFGKNYNPSDSLKAITEKSAQNSKDVLQTKTLKSSLPSRTRTVTTPRIWWLQAKA